MTRLLETDIKSIPQSLPAYDKELISKTRCSLFQIACQALGVNEETVQKSLANARVGVIPITTGLGRLEGFCEAVAAIANFIGCQTDITRQSDVAGIGEAIASGTDIIIMADEQRFMAINVKTKTFADNAVATARGFVTALNLMTGYASKDQRVLVLGCGPVGQNAVKTLLASESPVSIYDIDPLKSASVLESCKPDSTELIHRATDLEDALLKHALIVDASPAGAFIRERHIKSDTMISAPGMPLGLDRAAQAAIDNRLIHDPLQIGVATMLVDALVIK